MRAPHYAQNYAREEPTPAHSCSLLHLVSFEFVQKLAFSRTFLGSSGGLQNLHPRFKSGRRLHLLLGKPACSLAGKFSIRPDRSLAVDGPSQRFGQRFLGGTVQSDSRLSNQRLSATA